MSSNPFSQNLSIYPEPSRVLAAALITVHGVAVSMIVLLPWPLGPKLILNIIILLSLMTAIRTHVLHHGKRAIREAHLQSDGTWEVTTEAGAKYEGRLLNDTFAHPRLVILNLKLNEGGRRSLVVLWDCVPKNTLKHLNVYLNWYANRLNPDE